jgi:hypothetical protein
MKKIIFTLFLFLPITALAGPFGTEMGMSKEELGIKGTNEEISTFKWKLASLPKTSKLIDFYVVTVTPKNGLCAIRAVGKDVTTSAYGTQLRSAFEKINKSLQKKYSKGESYDFLNAGSIWDDERDFMMGMLKKERHLAYSYKEENGSTMVENVSSVFLAAGALSKQKGYVAINYSFENHEGCSAEIDAVDDDAF